MRLFAPQELTTRYVSAAIAAAHNSVILIDTDQVFHGVERVDEQRPELPAIDRTARLHFVGGDSWQLRQGAEVLAEYSWPELRYSISWKAYCFRDAAEETLWRDGTDNLSAEFILARLETELRNRGVLTGARPEATEFALMLDNTFVTFPRASAAA